MALAGWGPPAGKKGWTLRRLAERIVELEGVPERSRERVRRRLKKACAQTASAADVVPPAAALGRVRVPHGRRAEVYHRPHTPQRPAVCLDECSKQPIGEVRTPLPPHPAHDDRSGQAEHYDCEYVRNGAANRVIAFEPLGGWRAVALTDRRRREDRAHCARDRVDGRYREADKLVLIMDQLNTRSLASLYQAFAPVQAKRRADRLESRHTPKHGSWLNMAQIALRPLGRDLPDRVSDRATLERHSTLGGADAMPPIPNRLAVHDHARPHQAP